MINNMKKKTPPKFKTGDRVIFINDYGRNCGEKVVIELHWNDIRGNTYHIVPSDTPWCPIAEKNLFFTHEVEAIKYAETHGEEWRRA
jgi:hypothetical protein